MEIWKVIDWCNDYQVSTEGRIRSFKNGKETILKPQINKKGYLYVGLCKNGKRKNFKIHKLVAIAFIPNTKHKKEVNHLDTDKKNNRVSNLEWATTSENMKHAWDNGLRAITKRTRKACQRNGKKRAKRVLQYDLEGNFIKEWESALEIKRQRKINNISISACCRGERKTAGGFIWKYKDTQ